MKRIVLILICLILMATMASCTQTQQDEEGNVTFYYRTDPDSYQPDASIISPDHRTVEDTTRIHNILNLYLAGPETTTLFSPFPKRTTLLDVAQQEGSVTITLSEAFTSVAGFDRTVACVCLAKTVIDLTGCEQVVILSGDSTDPSSINITLTADDILLTDMSKEQENN